MITANSDDALADASFQAKRIRVKSRPAVVRLVLIRRQSKVRVVIFPLLDVERTRNPVLTGDAGQSLLHDAFLQGLGGVRS